MPLLVGVCSFRCALSSRNYSELLVYCEDFNKCHKYLFTQLLLFLIHAFLITERIEKALTG